MAEIIFKAENVTKQYKTTKAINKASFEVERGRIYGFIGQNGAGKTTFIRLITGMAKPNVGTISLFGSKNEKELVEARKKIGCIIESPSFHPNFTAEENIEIQKILYNKKDPNLAQELLKLVGLDDTKKKKAKDFSLGMRQRLSIAMSLVNDPEFLVLDEPINGLDPVGIKEVRDLIIKLNKEKNMTVLISSHILSELYQLATDYVIIHKGKIIEELTHEDLEEKCNKCLKMKVDDRERAEDIIKNKLQVAKYSIDSEEEDEANTFRIYEDIDVAVLAREMMDARILVTELCTSGENLESYYIQLIGGADHE